MSPPIRIDLAEHDVAEGMRERLSLTATIPLSTLRKIIHGATKKKN
jgi:hypothetical protein